MTDNKNNTAEIGDHFQADLNPESVKDYLLANPDFFLRYPLILNEVTLPHSQKGAISLVELQAQQLREKVRELQTKMSQLMSVAKQNEQLYRIYAELHLQLFHCKNMQEVISALEFCVEDKLQLTAVSLKLFKDESSKQTIQFDHLLSHRFKGELFFFGRLTQDETAKIFGEEAGVKSVGLMLLKQENTLGMLAIGSNDERHFHPDMDTLLINQLQQFLTLLIPQFLAQE